MPRSLVTRLARAKAEAARDLIANDKELAEAHVLAADTERLGRAADVARALGRRDAAARLADLVTSLIRGNGARKEAA